MSDKYLTKFKQEIMPVTLITGMQIWWNFNFPAFIKLGNYWHLITAMSMSVIFIPVTILLFVTANDNASIFNEENGEDAGYFFRPIFKKRRRVLIFIGIHLIFAFLWYYNLLAMPNLYYIFYYFTGFIWILLFYRAAYRIPST